MRTSFGKSVCTLITVLALAGGAYAQTQGMQRRDDRRDARDTSRAVKNACKAGDDKTRAECRQQKHKVKQTSRQGGAPAAPPAAAAPAAPAAP